MQSAGEHEEGIKSVSLLLMIFTAQCQCGKRFETTGHQAIYYRAERIYLRRASDIYTFISSLWKITAATREMSLFPLKISVLFAKWWASLGEWHRWYYTFPLQPLPSLNVGVVSALFHLTVGASWLIERDRETCLYQRPGMRHAVKAQLHWQIQFSLAHKIFKSSGRSESQPCGKYQGQP